MGDYDGYVSLESKRRFRLIAIASCGAVFLLVLAAFYAPFVPVILAGRIGTLPLNAVRWSFAISMALNVLAPALAASMFASSSRRCRTDELAPGVMLAPLWRRALAKALDYAIAFVPGQVAMLCMLGSILDLGPAYSAGLSKAWFFVCLAANLWAFFWGILFVRSEGRSGRSPGKTLLGIRVVGEDLQPCGAGRALVRNLFGFIDGFPFGLLGTLCAALTVRAQRVGDLVARTIVIRDVSKGG